MTASIITNQCQMSCICLHSHNTNRLVYCSDAIQYKSSDNNCNALLRILTEIGHVIES